MSKGLLKNTGIYFITNLISQAAVFVLWLIIAKILLPSDIGMYALVLFVVDFFCAISIFGIHTAITRFYASSEKLSSILFNACLIILLANLFSLVLFFALGKLISLLLPSISSMLIANFFLFAGLILFSSFYNLGLSHYAASKKAFWYAFISLAQTITFFACSLVFLALGFGILGILWALFISFTFSTLVFLAKELKNLSFNYFSFKTLKSLLAYAYPMMLYATFGTVTMYAGRIFLDRYTTLSTLGIYSFFLIIALQVNAVFSTFNKAWTPEIFSELETDRAKALRKVTVTAFLCSFVYLIFVALLIILKNIGFLHLFIDPLYLDHVFILYLLLLGPLFSGIYTATYPLFYFQKKTKTIFLISLSVNIVEIFLTFFLVKIMGENGAALSYVISIFLSFFILLFAFKKSMEIPKEIILFSTALLLVMSLNTYLLLKFSSEALFFGILLLSAAATFWYGKLHTRTHYLPRFIL